MTDQETKCSVKPRQQTDRHPYHENLHTPHWALPQRGSLWMLRTDDLSHPARARRFQDIFNSPDFDAEEAVEPEDVAAPAGFGFPEEELEPLEVVGEVEAELPEAAPALDPDDAAEPAEPAPLPAGAKPLPTAD